MVNNAYSEKKLCIYLNTCSKIKNKHLQKYVYPNEKIHMYIRTHVHIPTHVPGICGIIWCNILPCRFLYLITITLYFNVHKKRHYVANFISRKITISN